MNSTASTHSSALCPPPSAPAQPAWGCIRVDRWLRRLIPVFGECLESLRCVKAANDDQIRRQEALAADIAAIDDAMERAAPTLAECLRNDPPAKRRLVWQAWQEAHALTEQRAREAKPTFGT